MKFMRKLLPVVALGFAVTACKDETLAVENLDSPDVDRVFSTPASIEAVIGTGMQGCHNAHTVNADLNAQLFVLALESYSQLNNFNMGPRGAIPRPPVVNAVGTDGNHFAAYSRLSRNGRLAVNAIRALDTLLLDPLKTLGSAAQNSRARAFAFFAIGCNQGFLALMYDSAGVMNHGTVNAMMHPDSTPPLSGYQDVLANALAMIDSAIVQAQATATSSTGFPVPATWLSGSAHSSQANFIRLMRSYKARFRAGVARTPAERAAVDWNAVLADVLAGIQANVTHDAGASTGWNTGFVGSQMHQEPAWHQMSLMYFGMADQAGGCYDTYISLPRDSRNPDCLIITADNRWPAGATRAAQRTASVNPTVACLLSCRPYIQNRTVQDAPGDAWGWSHYNFFRSRYLRDNSPSNSGPFPSFMLAENNLLAAEAYLRRTNGQVSGATALDIQNAAALIDLTRTASGLPALSGVVLTTAQAVPGGGSCVPRVPQGPAFTTNACGTIFEALKYEKRMETAFTGFGQWFVDGRGWGDLIENTPLQYPVPFAELNARQKPSYSLGGGGVSSAPKGTYGF